jgi:GntR family transcriptional regulator, hexuronate regulon transcriptional repressor
MDRDHLHNRALREIIALIASGAYDVGERLPAERTLCAQFGVSRGTLRKALAGLEKLDVVSIRHGSGAYVESLTPAHLPEKALPPDFDGVTIEDIVEARRAIELAALDAACAHVTASQLKELEDLVADMAASVDDLPEFLRGDMEFHRAIVRAGGNRVLVTAFDAIYEYHRFSAVFTARQDGEEARALDCHTQLLAALKARNKAQARSVLSRHLDRVKDDVLQQSAKEIA